MIKFIDDVSTLSNEELLSYSVSVARHEKEVGLRLISCLREAEKRMLYSELALGSLWEYATQYLGLSNGNAQMKIDAMRLARDNPIAKEKIESGELSITNAAKVNSFLRNEKKAGHSYTSKEKTEVIESVLGLSQSKCERVLLELSPEAIPAEKVRPLTETKTELKIIVDEKTMAVLGRLKELLSHKIPGATYAELLDYLARDKVATLEKKQMGLAIDKIESENTRANLEDSQKIAAATDSGETQTSTPVGGVNKTPTPRVYIPVEDRRWVMRRAQGQCEFVSKAGDRCLSRYQVEVDHVRPLYIGGKNDRTNYRACCKKHNLYYAKVTIGNLMNKYVPSFN